MPLRHWPFGIALVFFIESVGNMITTDLVKIGRFSAPLLLITDYHKVTIRIWSLSSYCMLHSFVIGFCFLHNWAAWKIHGKSLAVLFNDVSLIVLCHLSTTLGETVIVFDIEGRRKISKPSAPRMFNHESNFSPCDILHQRYFLEPRNWGLHQSNDRRGHLLELSVFVRATLDVVWLGCWRL